MQAAITGDELLARNAEFTGHLARELAAQAPRPVNLSRAEGLDEVRVLGYRARRFRVPPVPYYEAMNLLVLDQELAGIGNPTTPAAMTRVAGIVAELALLFYRLVGPLTLFDRLTWRLRANPFLDIGLGEVGSLTRFFSIAGTRSSVRSLGSIWAGGRPRRWTSRRPSHGWSTPIPHGAGTESR